MMAMLIIRTVIGSVLTLYMLAIVIRWTAPWIELDLKTSRLHWLPRLTDPLIALMGRVLPPMGPMDWSPIAALVAVWIVRIVFAGY